MAVSLRDVPWRLLHDLALRSRHLHFTVDVPAVDGLVIERRLEDVREVLAIERWEDGRLPSYRYHGEDLNLRRPAGLFTTQAGEGPYWMQDHARFFETAGGDVWVICHHEPSPLAHPYAHYHEIGFSWERGTEHVLEQLDVLGATYRFVSRADVDLAAEG